MQILTCHPCSCPAFSKSCPTLCDPVDCSTPGFPVHHQLLELAQTHIHRVGDAIQHLIPSHPLLLLPLIFLSIRVFSNELALPIRKPKYWSFSIGISPSNEYSGLISFRSEWFNPTLDLINHRLWGWTPALCFNKPSRGFWRRLQNKNLYSVVFVLCDLFWRMSLEIILCYIKFSMYFKSWNPPNDPLKNISRMLESGKT